MKLEQLKGLTGASFIAAGVVCAISHLIPIKGELTLYRMNEMCSTIFGALVPGCADVNLFYMLSIVAMIGLIGFGVYRLYKSSK